jgi:hypothetical protein
MELLLSRRRRTRSARSPKFAEIELWIFAQGNQHSMLTEHGVQPPLRDQRRRVRTSATRL